MSALLDYPLAVLAVSLAAQWLAAYFGDRMRTRRRPAGEMERSDFDTIVPAALGLLSLLIGFSFSMAASRYDQRKIYEEAEANAIGSEHERAGLLTTAEAARVRALLASYTEQRILFYEVRDQERLRQVDEETAVLQRDLWSAVTGPAADRPTPVAALVVAGMNEVLDSQGRTQAAWWNRSPVGAWLLMGLVAVACNLLLGYSERHGAPTTLLILPLLVAICLGLIADIDSPRHGFIRVVPHSLIALYETIKEH